MGICLMLKIQKNQLKEFQILKLNSLNDWYYKKNKDMKFNPHKNKLSVNQS